MGQKSEFIHSFINSFTHIYFRLMHGPLYFFLSGFGQAAEVHQVTHGNAMFLGCESLSR